MVEAVEASERARAADQPPSGSSDFAEAFRAQWQHFSRSEYAGRERLFFECYARGLTGEEPFARMHPTSITDWVTSNGTLLRAAGMPAARARATSRLYVAVIRGLLLDLLATGDRKGVTDALEVFLEGHDPLSGPPRGSSAGRAPGHATTSPRRGRPG